MKKEASSCDWLTFNVSFAADDNTDENNVVISVLLLLFLLVVFSRDEILLDDVVVVDDTVDANDVDDDVSHNCGFHPQWLFPIWFKSCGSQCTGAFCQCLRNYDFKGTVHSKKKKVQNFLNRGGVRTKFFQFLNLFFLHVLIHAKMQRKFFS